MINVKNVLDSVNSATGDRLTTFRIRVPKFLLAEINTHRALSRNFASSRAIPSKKIRSQVMSDPFIPIYWGANQKGMSAAKELTGFRKSLSIQIWKLSRWLIPPVIAHWALDKIGLHKQTANRLLEPYMWAEGVISGTEWNNFFTLRCHPDAQPEFQMLARQMKDAYDSSVPQKLDPGEYHLPLCDFSPLDENHKKYSAAMCASVSYEIRERTLDDCLNLYDRLAASNPKHLSPLEHQARALYSSERVGNFVGFKQFRKELENESGGDYQ